MEILVLENLREAVLNSRLKTQIPEQKGQDKQVQPSRM